MGGKAVPREIDWHLMKLKQPKSMTAFIANSKKQPACTIKINEIKIITIGAVRYSGLRCNHVLLIL